MASAKDDYNSWDENDPPSKPVCKISQKCEQPKCFSKTEDEDIVIKSSCLCKQCVHWTQSNDWSMLEFGGCTKTSPWEKRDKPFIRSEKHPGRTPKISAFNTNNLSNVERQAVSRIVVHGEIIPPPVKNISDTYFSKEIQKSLAELNYRYSLPLQAFAWPAIFRQLNVFMIGEQNSGKTMSYLPAICTFCSSEYERYHDFVKYRGPLVVIICLNSDQCQKIYDLIKKIFSNTRKPPKVAVVTYPITPTNYTDILITIPESLIHCLQERIFNLKRLCHLVIEDASTLLIHFENIIYKTFEVIDEMLNHRPSNHRVQLILTSTGWSTALEKLYKTIYVNPLICISNYLEAALYGGIQFRMNVLSRENRKQSLIDILHGKFHLYKTAVFCDQSEISEVHEFLIQQNIETICLSDDATKKEIEVKETEWLCMRGGKYKVLLCTDFVFETPLNVNDAMWLVHYSFPVTWTRFTKRFSALSSNYQNPWNRNEESVQCESFLLFDDSCEQQVPKIVRLFKRLVKLPDTFKQLEKEHILKKENKKISDKVYLCDRLKLFGKCSKSFCGDRHLVKEEVDISEDLPQKGKILFKILNMKDVTQYTVQLLEHIDLAGTVRKISNDNLKDPLVFASSSEKIQPKKIRVGKFYAHCDNTTDGEVFTLCHVLSVNKDKIEVKLLSGFTMQTIKRKLYEVPPDLKIVDIYVCNLVPPFQDEFFSTKSFLTAKTSLQHKNYKNLILSGDILLQLDRTFWLSNVVESAKFNEIEVIKFDLTKHLVNLKVVKRFTGQITELHKLCTKCGIKLSTYVKKNARKPVKEDQIEPQTAFLNDNVNEVYLVSAINPDEIYVQLTKFRRLLESLEEDIQKEIETNVHKILNIEIGRYYLAPDPRSGESYFRAKVLKTEQNKALCFYVDYGDEAVVDMATLKSLPNKFITRLPFQAIQCRLYGLSPVVGNWDDTATDLLYKYMFEPDSDIFRSLYVEVRAKDDGDIVRAKTKYSVLMKDGFRDPNLLINQLLLDCGLAKSIFEKIDDFEIPQPQVVEESSDDSEIEEINNFDGDNVSNEEVISQENTHEGFDIEILNSDDFLEMMGMPISRRFQTPQLTYETNDTRNKNVSVQEITPTATTDSYLTPEVYWSQTKTTVKLRIQLINVASYKTNIIRKRFFIFSTNLEDRSYQLKFTLYRPAELHKHRALGLEVEIILNKIAEVEWMQLTGTSKRLRHIHYDIPDLEEEKRRKILDLGISDDDSDAEDVMVHEVSDMDSDIDEEFVESSSE